MSEVFSRVSEWIGEKLGPGAEDRRLLYALIGGLILIIVASLTATFLSLGGPSQTTVTVPEEMHFWCQETAAEVLLKREAAEKDPAWEMGTAAMPGGMRFLNPQTSRRTLVPMRQCPKCQRYYVPEALKKPAPAAPGVIKSICPYCGTDRTQWYREHRERR